MNPLRMPFSRWLLAVALVAGLWGFSHFHDDLKEFATYLVNTWGDPALFTLTLLADGIIQPIPPDVFVFGSAFGGERPLQAALVAGVASACGGLLGWAIGLRVGPWRFRRWFGNELLRTGCRIFRRYGCMVIVVGAVTPVPFSATCWIAGIHRLSPVIVFVTSLVCRVPRFLLAGWLGSVS